MKALLCILFGLFGLSVFSQEICNNGMDDDGDGFTDCADPDCQGVETVFPIIENFEGATFDNPNWVATGSAYINTGWLTLTDDLGAQAGSAFLDTAFVSTNHIIIEFDYATVNYNGDNCTFGIGDGLAFYLANGTAGPSVGEPGAALGYSHGVSGDPNRGIDGGFIGIGLDEFGSFYGTNAGPSTCPPSGDDAVTIRGEETNDNFTAYACLATSLLPWNMDIDVASRDEARRVRVLLSPGGVLDLYINFNDGTGYIPVFAGLSTGQVVPPTFKLGFSASTGGACIAHEIDNVIVAKPAGIDVEIDVPSDHNICSGNIDYTITAVNHGPNDVSQVYLESILPPEMTNVSWNCQDCIPASGSGSINAGIDIVVGDTVMISVSGEVPSSLQGSDLLIAAGIDFACTDFISSDIENSEDEASVAISQTPIDLDLGTDADVCEFPVLLDASSAVGTYTWQDGSTGSTFSALTGGIYWVEVTSGACSTTDSIVITDVSFLLDLGLDRNLCSGPVSLDASTPGAVYLWQDGSTGPQYDVSAAGIYWVEVTAGGCTLRDSVLVEDSSFEVDLGGDTSLCNNPIILDASEPNAQYLWSDGSTGNILSVSTGGSYWVEVFLGSCSSGDTAIVLDNSFSVDIGDDRSVCESSVVLDATTPGAEYLWQDSSTTPTLTAASNGSYSVVVTRNGCSSSASVDLDFIDCTECNVHPPTAFSPNFDGRNDFFKLIFDCEVSFFNIEIFNRWGEMVFTSDDPDEGWDGSFKGEQSLLDVFTWQAVYSDDQVDGEFITGVLLVYR